MSETHATLRHMAARLRRIGGGELTAAADLVSVALSLDRIDPEAEHALFYDLWGHVTRALDHEDFDAARHDDVRSLESEMAGHVLSYRLARGWLVKGAEAPIEFPTFSETIKTRSECAG